MDEQELSIEVDNIIKGPIWLSTIIDHNVDVESLLHYCKRVKEERETILFLFEYFKVHDFDIYQYLGVNVYENYFLQIIVLRCRL